MRNICLVSEAKQFSARRESHTVTGLYERMQTSGRDVMIYFNSKIFTFMKDLTSCESRHGVCLDYFKTLWMFMVSCQFDKCVIVCSSTLFSNVMY